MGCILRDAIISGRSKKSVRGHCDRPVRSYDECRFAQYINKNRLMGISGIGFGSINDHNSPRGCIWHENNRMYWNQYHNPRQRAPSCGRGNKACICYEDKCVKCPKNQFSKGGVDGICYAYKQGYYYPNTTTEIKCPEGRPYTYENIKHDSSKSCSDKKEAAYCDVGEGLPPTNILFRGHDKIPIESASECKKAAIYNKENNIDDNGGFER